MTGGPPIESRAGSSGDGLAPPGEPGLPPTAPPDESAPPTPGPTRAVPPVYRTEAQRAKSVYRRANPWYRRLGRTVVGLCFLAAGAGALYFGARELQDYLNRDRLPSAGAEIPTYETTTFQVTSTSPSPAVDGTLRIDVNTRAYEFTGRASGAMDGVQLVSPDGNRVASFVDGAWREVGADDPFVPELTAAIPFLVGVDTADDILVNQMRNGYVDLLDQTTEGAGDDAFERYEIAIDVTAYSGNQPLQWKSFQQEVIPAATEDGEIELTFWLDQRNVVVRLRSLASNWSWERVDYSDQAISLPPEALAALG